MGTHSRDQATQTLLADKPMYAHRETEKRGQRQEVRWTENSQHMPVLPVHISLQNSRMPSLPVQVLVFNR